MKDNGKGKGSTDATQSLSTADPTEAYLSQSVTIYIQILENLLAWANENKKNTVKFRQDINSTLQKLKAFEKNENEETKKKALSSYSLFKTFIDDHHSIIDQYCTWLSSLMHASESSTFMQKTKSVSMFIITKGEKSQSPIEKTSLLASAKLMLPHTILSAENFPSYDQQAISKIDKETIRKSEIKSFLKRIIDFVYSYLAGLSSSLLEESESAGKLLNLIWNVNNALEYTAFQWQDVESHKNFLFDLKKLAREAKIIDTNLLTRLATIIMKFETNVLPKEPLERSYRYGHSNDRFSKALRAAKTNWLNNQQKIALLALPKEVQTMLMIIYSYRDVNTGNKTYLAHAIKFLPALLLSHLIEPDKSVPANEGEGTSTASSEVVRNDGSKDDPLDFLYQKIAAYYAIYNFVNRTLETLKNSNSKDYYKYLTNFPRPNQYHSLEKFFLALKSITLTYTANMIRCESTEMQKMVNDLENPGKQYGRFGQIIERSIAQIPQPYYTNACHNLRDEIKKYSFTSENKTTEDLSADKSDVSEEPLSASKPVESDMYISILNNLLIWAKNNNDEPDSGNIAEKIQNALNALSQNQPENHYQIFNEILSQCFKVITYSIIEHAPKHDFPKRNLSSEIEKGPKSIEKTHLLSPQEVLSQCLDNHFQNYDNDTIKGFFKYLIQNICPFIGKASNSLEEEINSIIAVLTKIQKCNAAYECAKGPHAAFPGEFLITSLKKFQENDAKETREKDGNYYEKLLVQINDATEQFRAGEMAQEYWGKMYSLYQVDPSYGKRFGVAIQKTIFEISLTKAKMALLALPIEIQYPITAVYSYANDGNSVKSLLVQLIQLIPLVLSGLMLKRKISEEGTINSSSGSKNNSNQYEKIHKKIAEYYVILNFINRSLESDAMHYAGSEECRYFYEYIARIIEKFKRNTINAETVETVFEEIKVKTIEGFHRVYERELRVEHTPLYQGLTEPNGKQYKRFGEMIDRASSLIPEKYSEACKNLQAEILSFHQQTIQQQKPLVTSSNKQKEEIVEEDKSSPEETQNSDTDSPDNYKNYDVNVTGTGTGGKVKGKGKEESEEKDSSSVKKKSNSTNSAGAVNKVFGFVSAVGLRIWSAGSSSSKNISKQTAAHSSESSHRKTRTTNFDDTNIDGKNSENSDSEDLNHKL